MSSVKKALDYRPGALDPKIEEKLDKLAKSVVCFSNSLPEKVVKLLAYSLIE